MKSRILEHVIKKQDLLSILETCGGPDKAPTITRHSQVEQAGFHRIATFVRCSRARISHMPADFILEGALILMHIQ